METLSDARLLLYLQFCSWYVALVTCLMLHTF